jgi:hypothetical protein
MMDPVTVDKVKMVKNGDALIAEMKADNIEEDQMPDWLGGRASHPGISMQEVARKYVVDFQKSTAAAAAPAAAAEVMGEGARFAAVRLASIWHLPKRPPPKVPPTPASMRGSAGHRDF